MMNNPIQEVAKLFSLFLYVKETLFTLITSHLYVYFKPDLSVN